MTCKKVLLSEDIQTVITPTATLGIISRFTRVEVEIKVMVYRLPSLV
jgi:hypothetical protein